MKEFIVPEPSHAKTHDASELRRLLERVEAASGRLADEDIGRVICAAMSVLYVRVTTCMGDDGSDELSVWSGPVSVVWGDYRSRAPDVSLDGATRLIEEALIGWSWGVSGAISGQCVGMLYKPSPGGYRLKLKADGKTPALALLAALLKALLAQAEGMAVGDGTRTKSTPAQPS